MFGGFTNRKNFGNENFPQRIIAQFGNVQDANAAAFILAANITDNIIQQSINFLVVSLKNAGLWSKMRVLYPFVGLDANTQSFNLLNPASLKITWINAPTFTATGVLGNGVNQYGLGATSQHTNNDVCFSAYVRNNGVGIILGNNNAAINLTPRIAGNVNLSGSNALFTGASQNFGYFLGTKNATFLRSFHNGIFCTQAATSLGTTGTSFNILSTSGSGVPGNFSTQEVSFIHSSIALTDLEVLILYNIVQQFQTLLSRQV